MLLNQRFLLELFTPKVVCSLPWSGYLIPYVCFTYDHEQFRFQISQSRPFLIHDFLIVTRRSSLMEQELKTILEHMSFPCVLFVFRFVLFCHLLPVLRITVVDYSFGFIKLFFCRLKYIFFVLKKNPRSFLWNSPCAGKVVTDKTHIS